MSECRSWLFGAFEGEVVDAHHCQYEFISLLTLLVLRLW